jgi:hypothetical protein
VPGRHLKRVVSPGCLGEAKAKACELIEFRYYRYPDLRKKNVIGEMANALNAADSTLKAIVYSRKCRLQGEMLNERLERARAAGRLIRLYGKTGPLDHSDDDIARVYGMTGCSGDHEGVADECDAATADDRLRRSWRTDLEAATNDLYPLACRLADPAYAAQMGDEHRRGTTTQKNTLRQARSEAAHSLAFFYRRCSAN